MFPRFRLLWLIWMGLVLLACNLSSNSASPSTLTPSNNFDTPSAPTAPAQSTPLSPASPSAFPRGPAQALPTSANPNLNAAMPPAFSTALEDLSRQLGLSIQLICTNPNDASTCILSQPIQWSWTEQTFSNSALDCPTFDGQAGTFNGYLFTFTFQNIIYDYRAEETGRVFFCRSDND